MPRVKSPLKQLQEALKADDSLAILRAQRLLVMKDLEASEEHSARSRSHGIITQLTREIIKLEGVRATEEDEVADQLIQDQSLRKNPLAGI